MTYPTGDSVNVSQLTYETQVVTPPPYKPFLSTWGVPEEQSFAEYQMAYALVGVNNRLTPLSPPTTLTGVFPITSPWSEGQAAACYVRIPEGGNCRAVGFAMYYRHRKATRDSFTPWVTFSQFPLAHGFQIKFPWIGFCEYANYLAGGQRLHHGVAFYTYEQMDKGAVDEDNAPIAAPTKTPHVFLPRCMDVGDYYVGYCYTDMYGNETDLSPLEKITLTARGFLEVRKWGDNWHNIPHGACHVHIYVGRSPTDLHRQPLLSRTDQRVDARGYEYPVEFGFYNLFQFVESGIRPAPVPMPRSQLNSIQVAIRQGYKKIYVDVDDLELYCPIIRPYDVPTFGSEIEGKSIMLRVRHVNTYNGVALKNQNIPLYVESNQMSVTRKIQFHSSSARVGLAGYDPCGGGAFHDVFDRVSFYLNQQDDTVGLQVSNNSSAWNGYHTSSEWRLEKCTFVGHKPILLEGNQTCNFRFSDTSTGYVALPEDDEGCHSAMFHFMTPNFVSFLNGWYTFSGEKRARYLVEVGAGGAPSYIDIASMFDDQTFFHVLVGRGSNDYTGMNIRLSKSNSFVPFRRIVECLHGFLDLTMDKFQFGDFGVYASNLNGVRIKSDTLLTKDFTPKNISAWKAFINNFASIPYWFYRPRKETVNLGQRDTSSVEVPPPQPNVGL